MNVLQLNLALDQRFASSEPRRETRNRFAVTMTRESAGKRPKNFCASARRKKQRPKKGHLKIFLGYASGVGKSFRMLDEARRRRERGQDVVVGAIQPQVPPEVEALLQKLEVIPLKRSTAARRSTSKR